MSGVNFVLFEGACINKIRMFVKKKKLLSLKGSKLNFINFL